MQRGWLDKVFHPHRKTQEEIRTRIQELQELSNIALEIGNRDIYRSLQVEANELLMKYLMHVFFDGLRFILPHFFMLAIISSYTQFIQLPFGLPYVGNQIAVVLAYPVAAIAGHLLYKKYKGRKAALVPVNSN